MPVFNERSLYLNAAPLATCCVTAKIVGSASMPRASASVIAGLRRSGHDDGSVGSHELKPPIGRRYTKNDVGPAAATSRANASFTPRTTDDKATTTNTPIATPMIVSAARDLLERIASNAIATPSNAWTNLVTRLIAGLQLPSSSAERTICG